MSEEIHEAEGSFFQGWPALLLSIGVIGAAVYSFTPRPDPPFPPTRVQVDELLVTDIVRRGERLIAVGEQGKILFADDPSGPWQTATISPNRGATLTRAAFVEGDTVVAVGHGSWILRSSDAGQSWTEVLFAPDKAEPLQGVAGPFDGRLYAYGAFGQLQVSSDLGRSWERQELVKAEEAASESVEEPANDPSSDDYNPFADFGSGGGFAFDDFSSRHINAVNQLADGSLVLAGERGTVARSTDGGQTWTELDTGYSGSFYGVLEPAPGVMLVHGMRGNVFRSEDGGQNWTASQVPVAESLYGGRVTANGEVLLVGGGNAVLRSSDGGKSFRRMTDKDNQALAAVLPLAAGRWLTAGENGVRLQTAAGEGA
mgnify:CR=1 FL=1